MVFKNNIINAKIERKIQNAVIINGLLEIETLNYFSKRAYKYFVFPEICDQPFVNDNIISFEKNSERIVLCSNQAIRISAASSLFDKVFCISGCFRNEHYDDGVHLSSFKMLEVEFKSDSEEPLFILIESYLKHMINWFNDYIVENNLMDVFEKININFPIARKKFDTMYAQLSQNGDKPQFDPVSFVDDEITKYILQPTFVTYYPSIGRWRALKKDNEHSYLFNLVLPNGYGELFEFSLKETDYDFYYSRFKENGSLEYYKWYLDSIKEEKMHHASLGMGIERLGAWLMGLDSIDEQHLFSCLPKGGV